MLNKNDTLTVSDNKEQFLPGFGGESVGHKEGDFDESHVDKVINPDVQHEAEYNQKEVLQKHSDDHTDDLEKDDTEKD